MEEAGWTLVNAPPARAADATRGGGTNSVCSLKSRRPAVALAHADFDSTSLPAFSLQSCV